MSNITNNSSDILVILDELGINLSPSLVINSPNANFQGSSSSASSTAIVNDIGAGGESQATTISPTGEVQQSSESVFIPGATSSQATATAISGTDILPTTEATVIIETENHNPPPTPLINVDADVFVLNTNPNFPNTNPNLVDIITNFNAAEGDKIGLSENLITQPLILETFDSNINGSLDATVIKLGSDSQSEVLGVVLGTVSANGQTTLTITDFTVISNNLLILS